MDPCFPSEQILDELITDMELPGELNRDMDDWQIRDALMYEYEDLWEPLEKKATELTRERMGLDVDLTDLLSTRPVLTQQDWLDNLLPSLYLGGAAGSTRLSRMSPSDRGGHVDMRVPIHSADGRCHERQGVLIPRDESKKVHLDAVGVGHHWERQHRPITAPVGDFLHFVGFPRIVEKQLGVLKLHLLLGEVEELHPDCVVLDFEHVAGIKHGSARLVFVLAFEKEGVWT